MKILNPLELDKFITKHFGEDFKDIISTCKFVIRDLNDNGQLENPDWDDIVRTIRMNIDVDNI